MYYPLKKTDNSLELYITLSQKNNLFIIVVVHYNSKIYKCIAKNNMECLKILGIPDTSWKF